MFRHRGPRRLDVMSVLSHGRPRHSPADLGLAEFDELVADHDSMTWSIEFLERVPARTERTQERLDWLRVERERLIAEMTRRVEGAVLYGL